MHLAFLDFNVVEYYLSVPGEHVPHVTNYLLLDALPVMVLLFILHLVDALVVLPQKQLHVIFRELIIFGKFVHILSIGWRCKYLHGSNLIETWLELWEWLSWKESLWIKLQECHVCLGPFALRTFTRAVMSLQSHSLHYLSLFLQLVLFFSSLPDDLI